jgi:hypothetical protein
MYSWYACFAKGETRKVILKILKNRRHLSIGHIVRHNKLVVNVVEGTISGNKKAVGLQYLKQDARNAAADSYTAMQVMACNKSRSKAASQSKD